MENGEFHSHFMVSDILKTKTLTQQAKGHLGKSLSMMIMAASSLCLRCVLTTTLSAVNDPRGLNTKPNWEPKDTKWLLQLVIPRWSANVADSAQRSQDIKELG